jgi:hypothetical protein
MARTGFKNMGAVDQTITVVRPFVVVDQSMSGTPFGDVSKATFTSYLNTQWNGSAIVFSAISGSGATLLNLNGVPTYIVRALTASITLAVRAAGILDICRSTRIAALPATRSYQVRATAMSRTPNTLEPRTF